MFTRLFSAALGAVFALSLASAPAPADAQTPGAQQQQRDTATMQEADRLQNQVARNVSTGRQRRGRPAATPTPEQNRAGAEALLTATNTTCQIGETVLRGQIGQGENVYEVTCATGPGYVLIGTTPPISADCVLLAGQADITRARDPAADVGTQCEIASNKNIMGVITAYAAEAGVKCTVDQGSSVGKSSVGNVIYEVGCAGADGYWLEKTATGWTTTECMKLASQNATCKYTTPAEQAATLKTWLAGNADTAPCDVAEARYMGSNANGSFYEAKCGGGNGLIVRFDTAMAVQQSYPCETAQRIGGGCKLTVVPETEPAAPTTTQQ